MTQTVSCFYNLFAKFQWYYNLIQSEDKPIGDIQFPFYAVKWTDIRNLSYVSPSLLSGFCYIFSEVAYLFVFPL